MLTFDEIWGHGKDLDVLQMSSRAFVICFIAIALIRISGRRSFGKNSAFDNMIALLLGAVLSRAVVGASPFVPTVVACLVITLLHRLLAWLAIFSNKFGKILKGEKICLYEDGSYRRPNMSKSLVSEKDLLENVRLQINTDMLDKVDKAFMERNGEISVLKKE